MKLSVRTSIDYFTGASHSMILVLLLFKVISGGRLRFFVFLSAYFIALRGDTQHLSMEDFGNGYSRKREKQSQKRQNRTQNGKDRKRQSHSKPKVKVNRGKVKVIPDKSEAEKAKKIQFKGLKLSSLKSCINQRIQQGLILQLWESATPGDVSAKL
nr:hypothetical protein [Tanacetum cinerariifolium]